MQMTIKDKTTGTGLLTCELPKEFKTEGAVQLRQYPDTVQVFTEAKATSKNCLIGYTSGETYIYEKKKFSGMFGNVQQGPQSDSGAWYAVPASLKDDLDNTAASLLNKKVEAKAYYDFSPKMSEKAAADFDKQLGIVCEDFRLSGSVTSIPVANIFRNYLFDGGIGVYEDSGKVVAVSLYRIGFEMDIQQGQGIYEDIAGGPFGQAPVGPQAVTSSAIWNIPYITYLVSDSVEDLKTFFTFAESLELTPELTNYISQIHEETNRMQLQKAQLNNMQTQAAINTMWAQQQQAWAASDRLRDSLSRDLDEWRTGLNQSIAQSDARFTPSNPGFESSDDRIQRLRHESIMGVETYDRSDGSTVEYSSMADRVFENNLDSTQHFGTHHYYDDYIPEGWHELKKK